MSNWLHAGYRNTFALPFAARMRGKPVARHHYRSVPPSVKDIPDCFELSVTQNGWLLSINKAGMDWLGLPSLQAARRLTEWALLRRVLVALPQRRQMIELLRRLRANERCNTDIEVARDLYLHVTSVPQKWARHWLVKRTVAVSSHTRKTLSTRNGEDTITGLCSYRQFYRYMRDWLARQKESPVSLFYIDIDQFKRVNGSTGLELGNQLLNILGQRLLHAFPEALSVSHPNSDEFLVLVADDQLVANDYAERMLQLMERPVELAGYTFHLTASIGIACRGQDGHDVATLHRHADMAMHQAKRNGGQQIVFFHQGLQERVAQQFDLETRLRKALQDDAFSFYFQPKIDLKRQRIVGAEVLVRWCDGNQYIAPQTFIPLAEKLGLIVDLGEQVLEYTIAVLADWQQHSVSVSLAANLSAKQLKQPLLVEKIKGWLKQYQADPRGLQLEITEHALLEHEQRALQVIEQVRELGISIALDDFGTGYSSLQLVRQFPVDVLKIDRSFIDGIADSPRDQAIASAVIVLAHQLNMQVVAEGVERQADLAFLEQQHCDQVQGFFHYHPMSESKLFNLLVPGAA